jgi:hypothetical protein
LSPTVDKATDTSCGGHGRGKTPAVGTRLEDKGEKSAVAASTVSLGPDLATAYCHPNFYLHTRFENSLDIAKPTLVKIKYRMNCRSVYEAGPQWRLTHVEVKSYGTRGRIR